MVEYQPSVSGLLIKYRLTYCPTVLTVSRQTGALSTVDVIFDEFYA